MIKQIKDDEWVKLGVTISAVCDGSAMMYVVLDQSPPELSEEFKKVLRDDWDIDVDEY